MYKISGKQLILEKWPFLLVACYCGLFMANDALRRNEGSVSQRIVENVCGPSQITWTWQILVFVAILDPSFKM